MDKELVALESAITELEMLAQSILLTEQGADRIRRRLQRCDNRIVRLAYQLEASRAEIVEERS